MSQTPVQILPAVFTPMHEDCSIHFHQIENLYLRCVDSGFNGIFLNGTTGECMSLSKEERQQLVESWMACRKRHHNPGFRIFVHVGSVNVYEAAEMAAHAQAQGADGVAMVPTFYFRPKSIDELVSQCQYVAAAAPEVPFYYYNIPGMTGVNFPLISFVEQAARKIPTFAGLKNSFNDLVDYQQCLHFDNGRYDMYWGSDEVFMMVYAAGNRHYVGSTYNYMGSIYFSMMEAFHAGDLDKLNALQGEANNIYRILNDYNSLLSGKEIMRHLGIDCGPVRRPLKNLNESDSTSLVNRLKGSSFFDIARTNQVVRNLHQ